MQVNGSVMLLDLQQINFGDALKRGGSGSAVGIRPERGCAAMY
jgi:hypothetical protein